MNIYKLLKVLRRIKLLSPSAVTRLAAVIFRHGVNLMTLLRFAARQYGEKIALADEQGSLTYHQLLALAEGHAVRLRDEFGLEQGKKVGFICRNQASFIALIYAVADTGADICLLNADMSAEQLTHLLASQHFDLLILDEEQQVRMERESYRGAVLLSKPWSQVDSESASYSSNNKDNRGSPLQRNRRRASSGKLVLLSGGTTGKSKQVPHQPSLFNYLNPFYEFLTRLRIPEYRTAYIATPIYHGYGIAVLLLFCALGKKVVVHRGFAAETACRLISEHQVEVITVVPLMLHRLLRANVEDLKSLKCIASGGAELSPRVVQETQEQLGAVLYNLYGTSEAGLNLIATPADLAYSPRTLGKMMKGGSLSILDEQLCEVESGEVGQLHIRNNWSMSSRNGSWIATGDLGYRDELGYIYLSGRKDSMIVSGGENVYPHEVEQVLLTHPGVEEAAVIGVADELYGQRLKAFVRLSEVGQDTPDSLREWLRPRLARYQLPREVVVVESLPYTSLGKLDRKQL